MSDEEKKAVELLAERDKEIITWKNRAKKVREAYNQQKIELESCQVSEN